MDMYSRRCNGKKFSIIQILFFKIFRAKALRTQRKLFGVTNAFTVKRFEVKSDSNVYVYFERSVTTEK